MRRKESIRTGKWKGRETKVNLQKGKGKKIRGRDLRREEQTQVQNLIKGKFKTKGDHASGKDVMLKKAKQHFVKERTQEMR